MNVLRKRPATCGEGGKTVSSHWRRSQSKPTSSPFHTPLTKRRPFCHPPPGRRRLLRKLQRKPWFVNASRGAVHDTDALLHARKEGKISELIFGLLGKRTGYKPGIIELATIATRILPVSRRRESQWYAYVSEKHRKILPSEDREDQRSDSAAPETPVIDLNRFGQKPDRTSDPHQFLTRLP